MLAVLKISIIFYISILICNKALMHIVLRYNTWKAIMAFSKVNFS